MDESMFRSQLRDVRQRIDIHGAHHAKMMPSSPFTDTTSAPAQLQPLRDVTSQPFEDLKAHVAKLEARLTDQRHKLFVASHPHASGAIGLPVVEALTQQDAHSSPESNSLIQLPSGPLFWKLFYGLRADFESMDSRVSALTQRVSVLEDEFDNLDLPHVLTPASSTTGEQEGSQNSRDNSLAQAGMTEQTAIQQPLENDHLQDAVENILCELRQRLSQPTLPHDTSSPYSQAATLGTPVKTPKQTPSRFFAAELHAFEPTAILQAQPDRTAGLAGAKGSVAYRDREIGQLDDLLKSEQEKLKLSEEENSRLRRELKHAHNDKADALDQLETAHHRARDQITYGYRVNAEMYRDRRELQHKLYDETTRVRDLERTLFDFHAARDDDIDRIVAGRDAEIQRLQDFCIQKDDIAAQQEQLIARGAHLLEKKDIEIEVMTRNHKVTAENLAYEDSLNLQRARLMQERDLENAQLKYLTDSIRQYCAKRHDEMVRLGMVNIWRKSDCDVISAMLDGTAPHTVAALAPATENDATRNEIWEMDSVPLASIGRDDRSQSSKASHLRPAPFTAPDAWSQRPEGEEASSKQQICESWVSNPRRLSRDHSSISKPEQPYSETQYEASFRMISPSEEESDAVDLSAPQGESTLTSSRPKDTRLRSTESTQTHKFLGSLHQFGATNDTPERDHRSDRTLRRRHSRRNNKVPSDASFDPPLPAPVTPAYRRRSMRDLRPMTDSDRRNAHMKHRQSMQDLPQRRYQPYVEAEAEEDAELGGANGDV